MEKKYSDAISAYAFFRGEIKRLTGEISYSSKDENFDSRCGNIEGSGFDEHTTCIDRLWARSKEERELDEEFNRSGLNPDIETLPKVSLCESCAKVQALIDQRKQAKKQFGVEKRRILALGRALLNKQREQENDESRVKEIT